MSNSYDRIDKVYTHWHETVQKYDYYLATVSGALTAFVVQGLGDDTPGLNPAGLQAVAALVLGSSFALSLQRLRTGATALGANAQKLDHLERKEALAEARKDTAFHDKALRELEDREKKYKQQAEVAYLVRDILLIAGLGLYIVARIWKAFT